MLHQIVNHTIIILSITIVLAPSFAFVQGAAGNLPEVPGTLQDAASLFWQIIKAIPGATIDVFGEAIKIFGQLAKWAWAQWDKYIWPRIEALWGQILGLLGREVEKRTPAIEQELEKEKQEIIQEAQKEAQKAGESIWERLKELIKSKL